MNTFVVLCGGYGKRFQKVSKTLPKIIAEISPGISMLDWLIEDYLPPDSSVILATGHLHEKVSAYIKKKNYKNKLFLLKEKEKLGTGGALINASRIVDEEEFIALNGDTIHSLSMDTFLINSKLNNDVVINVGCTEKNKNDTGKILIDQNNYIKSFTEKELPKEAITKNINTVSSLGIYRCKTNFFKNLPISVISLEEKLLPKLVEKKIVKASIFKSDFQDFGTHERYNELKEKVDEYLKNRKLI